ncbi:MAG: Gfo/Idh/MocA family oxidoreductase, partial [Clostridia bacterium]|nr:Gfo/Idh/MocA family oxidoreductase [Clostridia bacterium]
MRKIVFNGFRHGHIDGLYKAVTACEELEIVGCYEPDAKARESAEARLGVTMSGDGYVDMLEAADIVAIGGKYGERGVAVIEALSAGKHVIADKPI